MVDFFSLKFSRWHFNLATSATPDLPLKGWMQNGLTAIALDRWRRGLEGVRDSPITMVTSLISISLSLALICSPPLCHLQLRSRVGERKEGWDVSPRWAWHLQIRAHYLGVTRSVRFLNTTGEAGSARDATHQGLHGQLAVKEKDNSNSFVKIKILGKLEDNSRLKKRFLLKNL